MRSAFPLPVWPAGIGLHSPGPHIPAQPSQHKRLATASSPASQLSFPPPCTSQVNRSVEHYMQKRNRYCLQYMTMRQPRLLHAVHHTGQLLLHRGSGGQGGQVCGQRRGESQGGRLQAQAPPHHSCMAVKAGTRASVCLLLQEACRSQRRSTGVEGRQREAEPRMRGVGESRGRWV